MYVSVDIAPQIVVACVAFFVVDRVLCWYTGWRRNRS